MDATIPWATWVGLVEPYYYADSREEGRKPKPIETMLRMYLLQVWFSLSDEGVEEAIYDSYAMRRFMGLDFAVSRSRMPPRCCTSGTCWKSTSWARSCSRRRTRSSSAGLDHAGGQHRGRDDHRCAVVDEERHW